MKNVNKCCATCNNICTDSCLGCGSDKHKHYEPTSQQIRVLKCLIGMEEIHKIFKTKRLSSWEEEEEDK